MKIGFVGCGNMASAIIGGIIASKLVSCADVCAYDTSRPALDKAKTHFGVTTCDEIGGLADCKILLLAVKPNVVQAVAQSAKGVIAGKPIISIVAGLPQKKLETLFENCTYLRAMPNTPAMCGEGMSVLVSNTTFEQRYMDFAQGLFDSVGKTVWLDEAYIDAAGTVSGCTPAYAYMFIEALADGGVLEGVARDVSMRLAAQAVLGAAKMVLESGKHPGELKDMVCSPGGMTIEGVKALEEGAFRGAVINSISTATQKGGKMLD